MKMMILLVIMLAVLVLSLNFTYNNSADSKGVGLTSNVIIDEIKIPDSLLAKSFIFPVGSTNTEGYYNAQGFGVNRHLGDDWNATSGGNSDLGDPVYAIGKGYVNTAMDYKGGWGNVIRITHYLPNGEIVESLYAHCDTLLVAAKSWVDIGDQIGTIGDAHGAYSAHLHFELRNVEGMPLGGGYSSDTTGYIDPTAFINSHKE